MHLEQETSISDYDETDQPSWDIFSAVVDNYGDIGICWRLSRQLVTEHGLKVRLWTDDLISFQKINPDINTQLSIQFSRGVEIRLWAEFNVPTEPAGVVIEAFGCKLPESYLVEMVNDGLRHAWVNLEYLSAEDWVDSHHGLPSPHPSLPLIKYFYFPGFSSRTGGLLVEKARMEYRRLFQTSLQPSKTFWQELGIPEPVKNEIRISLFCYPDNSATNLFTDLSKGLNPVTCLIPAGIATKQIANFFDQQTQEEVNLFKKGSLKLRVLPFFEQDKYDELLWACDFNFVRGEDSFIRAQWAARPMAWQIYPQEDGAHWPKLMAFVDRYCADLPPLTRIELTRFFDVWNGSSAGFLDWESLWAHRIILEKHAQEWANRLIKKEDLTTKLVNFCNNKLK